jgi:hypothetical protein
MYHTTPRTAIISLQPRESAEVVREAPPGSFAIQQCTAMIQSMTSISNGDFVLYSGRYCTAEPTPNPGGRGRAEETDAHFQQRLHDWRLTCVRDIATSLTADKRSRCAEDLRRGSGDYWDKFLIYAGSLGTFGWDVGTNHDQGYEAACTQQTNQMLLDSNKKKVQDDIDCKRRFGAH